jgi:hypothetical protein
LIERPGVSALEYEYCCSRQGQHGVARSHCGRQHSQLSSCRPTAAGGSPNVLPVSHARDDRRPFKALSYSPGAGGGGSGLLGLSSTPH